MGKSPEAQEWPSNQSWCRFCGKRFAMGLSQADGRRPPLSRPSPPRAAAEASTLAAAPVPVLELEAAASGVVVVAPEKPTGPGLATSRRMASTASRVALPAEPRKPGSLRATTATAYRK
jgi:hypothetical protein